MATMMAFTPNSGDIVNRSLLMLFLGHGTTTRNAVLAGVAWTLRRCGLDTLCFVEVQEHHAKGNEDEEEQEEIGCLLGDSAADH